MNKDSLKVLAINSFPANGNAGLKMVMAILGTVVIPVPTLLLTGIGSLRNMTGFTTFQYDFRQNLEGTLQIAQLRGYRLLVYVGYLGNARQVDMIRELVEKYHLIIETLWVDPVCGDQGHPYVSPEIIQQWPHLLEIADLALPNLTEIALISGHQADIQLTQPEPYIQAFRDKFPDTDLLVTSLLEEDKVINRLYQGQKQKNFANPSLPVNYGGAGDAFASLLIYYHFFRGLGLDSAIEKAGQVMLDLIRHAQTEQNLDLGIVPALIF